MSGSARFEGLSGRIGFAIVLLGLIVVPARLASAAPGPPKRSDIPVTTEVVDLDPLGNPYTVASDGGGTYPNGINGVTSILTANTYNNVATGDWQFNKPGTAKGKTVYSGRKMAISINMIDAVPPGDPHYTVAPTPPFLGTQILNSFAEVKCSLVNVSMGQMAANTATTCPLLVTFFVGPNDEKWGLSPAQSFFHYPDITDAQVSCNAADSAGCKDWFIEPIGSLQSVARCQLEGPENHGDFYMRFKFHVTRP